MNADVPLWQIVVRLLVLIGSFLARGFFAASETAFLSMDRWAIAGLKSSGDRRAGLLSALAADSSSTISALLIGTNVFTVLASVMGASIASLLGANSAVAVVIMPLAITAATFVFSELVPKSWAATRPTETALAAAVALSATVSVLRPIAVVLSAVPRIFAGVLADRKAPVSPGSDEPVRVAVELAAGKGQVEKEDGEAIVGVLDSSDTCISDVMVPMSAVTTFVPETKVCDALSAFRLHHFSRVPVVPGGGDQVLGVAYMKDVVREAMKTPGCQSAVRDLMRPLFTVSPADNLLDVLARMRRNRVHFAVVWDGNRSLGIATMEDILREIVGDTKEDARPKSLRRRSVTGSTADSDEGMLERDLLGEDSERD